MKREMVTQSMVKTRITALLLGMLLLVLTACGGESATAQPETASETQNTQPVEAEAETEEQAPDAQPVETELSAALPTTDPSGASIVIPDQVDSVVALAPRSVKRWWLWDWRIRSLDMTYRVQVLKGCRRMFPPLTR